jgi:hypothetical protein
MRNYLMATAAAAALLVAQPAYAEIITVDFTANIASDSRSHRLAHRRGGALWDLYL